MPANSALTVTEMSRLAAKIHSSKFYLSYVPDTVVASATVASTPTSTPITQILTTGESNWSDKRAGMTVKISAPDGTVRGHFLITETSGSGTLNIGEVDDSDPGLIPVAERSEGIQAGDEIEVLARFDMFNLKPFVSPDGVIYQRGNVAVGTYNSAPEVVVNVTINGEAGDYATIITTSTKAITAVAAPTPWPTSSGATYSYSWSYPAAMTGVSGAATSTLTGNLPPGSYWLYCTVTPSVGQPFTVWRWVRIHNAADMPLDLIIESDVADRTGRKMSIRMVESEMGAIPRGGYVLVWTDATWNGGDVASARKKFGGWIIKRPFSHSPQYHESRADILGVFPMLEKLASQGINFNYTGTTSTWEGLPEAHQNILFVMWWTLRWRTANVLQRFNFTVPDTSGTYHRRKNISVGSGTVGGQLKQLAEMIEVNIGSRSDGEILVAYHPSMHWGEA